jgi:methionyl-tRNA formyltransferase
MRIAAFGRTRMLYDTIKLLSDNGHEIVLIGTCTEAPEYDITAADFEDLAKNLQVPFFNTPSINSKEVVDMLYSCNADIAVSFNWLTVVGQSAIDAFPYGVLNAHPGDLPKYRGNACPNWAMLSNEENVVISIHQMESDKLDSGAIILKDSLAINKDTRIGEIYDFLQKTIPFLFLQAVDGLYNGTIKPQPQSTDNVLRCYPRIPSDSLINWREKAESILRLINASSEPFDGAYTFYNMSKLTIWRASIKEFEHQSLYVPGQVVSINRSNGDVEVAAADGIVVLHEVQLEDMDRIPPASIIKSMRTRLGMNIEDEIYKLHQKINIPDSGDES